jgi:phosphoketolase
MYPADANMIQAAYGWAVEQSNKAISIVASKSALPVHTTPEQARTAIERGAITLYESAEGDAGTIVFAVTGDMIYLPVFEARGQLEQAGYRVRIVCVANPRRLYRPGDVAWQHSAQSDGRFMDEGEFEALFSGDVLIGVSGGGTVALEPVLLRSKARARDLFGWQRGETTASPGEIMAFNGITADALATRAADLMDERGAGERAA